MPTVIHLRRLRMPRGPRGQRRQGACGRGAGGPQSGGQEGRQGLPHPSARARTKPWRGLGKFWNQGKASAFLARIRGLARSARSGGEKLGGDGL